MSEDLDQALGGYLLMCAGLGAMTGSMGFPFSFSGFFLPALYLMGFVMFIVGFGLMRWSAR